jgi:hypothetical protein
MSSPYGAMEASGRLRRDFGETAAYSADIVDDAVAFPTLGESDIAALGTFGVEGHQNVDQAAELRLCIKSGHTPLVPPCAQSMKIVLSDIRNVC